MRLDFPATCQCGADCPTGTDVRMERGLSPWPGILGRWRVVECPACSVECRRVVDSGEGMKAPGSNLAKRMERKERKRRAKG